MIGRTLGNRYEILEKIGDGGMAQVYKAKCLLLNRFVAIKVLKAEFNDDEEFINKFEMESQAAASLSHPNIVGIYDVGQEADIHYIVMEYIEGKTLKEYIKEKKRLSDEETIAISTQIAMALRHAHRNQIVHRDIKPHNIMVTSDMRIKVTDFGIARAITSSTITNTGSVVGSVHYFSPEQARGGYLDEKSDIYSLGITMYEMITGKVPFAGDTAIAVALKHLKEEIIPPSVINKEMNPCLNDIIMKATQKDINKRYKNTDELIQDLEIAKYDPNHKVDVPFDDESSPTRVLPKINEDMLNELSYDSEEGNNKKMSRAMNKEKKKTSKLSVLVGILTALALSVFLVGFFTVKMLDKRPKEVVMPDITNYKLEVAQKELGNIGLSVRVEKEVYSPNIEKGYIIRQTTTPGSLVKENFSVGVEVSQGKRQVSVPNLLNQDLTDAEISLNNTRLDMGTVEYEYNDLPAGMVIKQTPVSGTKVDEDTKINIVISQGPMISTIIMPRFIGKDLVSAKKAARTININISGVTYEFSEEYEDGKIIRQSIAAGKEVNENVNINLVVSKGSEFPEPPEVPTEQPETPGSNTEEVTSGNIIDSEGSDKSVSLDFIIPFTFSDDEAVVKIEKVKDGKSSLVHQSVHKRSDKELRLSIEGSGKNTINVYFNGKLEFSKEMDFK